MQGRLLLRRRRQRAVEDRQLVHPARRHARRTFRRPSPPRDKYNHIGAIAYSKTAGVLLPMECYNGTNCANTGAIGVADPATLAWEYEVKLDPATIKKAMWAAVSPNGKLLWTSSGNNLLAYDMADISPLHSWPAHAAIKPVTILKNAVPPSGVDGGCVLPGSAVPRRDGRQRPPGVVRRHVERLRAGWRSPAPWWVSRRASTSSHWTRARCTRSRCAAIRPAAPRRITRRISFGRRAPSDGDATSRTGRRRPPMPPPLSCRSTRAGESSACQG